MEILNFRDAPIGSYHLATFDVYFGHSWGMTLGPFKLYRNQKGHFYFKPPVSKKGEFEGKPLFEDFIRFDKDSEKGKDFSTSVMNMLKPFIEQIKAKG